MSEQIKGYVVRGVGKLSARTLWAEVIDRVNPSTLTETRERATAYPNIGEAIAAMLQMTGCRDVVILAVAEDGTETALPTYEQALAILTETRGHTCTPMRLDELPGFMSRALHESCDLGNALQSIVDAWEANEIGQIDGALIDAAREALGAPPPGKAPPPRAPHVMDLFDALPRDDRSRIKDEAEAARDAVRDAGGTKEAAKAAWDEAIRKGVAECQEEAAS